MPANGRWDLIRRLKDKVNLGVVILNHVIYMKNYYKKQFL